MIFYTPSQWYSERYGFTTSSFERYCRKMDVEITSYAMVEMNFPLFNYVVLTLSWRYCTDVETTLYAN